MTSCYHAAKWHVDRWMQSVKTNDDEKQTYLLMNCPWMNGCIQYDWSQCKVGVYLPTIDTCPNQLKRRFESLEVIVNNLIQICLSQDTGRLIRWRAFPYGCNLCQQVCRWRVRWSVESSSGFLFLCRRMYQKGTSEQQRCWRTSQLYYAAWSDVQFFQI